MGRTVTKEGRREEGEGPPASCPGHRDHCPAVLEDVPHFTACCLLSLRAVPHLHGTLLAVLEALLYLHVMLSLRLSCTFTSCCP